MSGHLQRLIAAASPARAVTLRVERVTLVGVSMSPAQSRRFGVALGEELQRLARAPGWPADVTAATLRGAIAPAVAMHPGRTPAQLGCDVARSVYAATRGAR